MHSQIQRLCQIANKSERWIIGLMSGTSLDGLDVALCRVTGNGLDTTLALSEFATKPYSADYQREIASVFSKRDVDLQKVCLLNAWVGSQHGKIVRQFLSKWNISAADVDLIASHGQTIYHAPKTLHKLQGFPDSTLQIGDGDHVARATGIITISDFRQRHIAAGGEGAPLAVYGDYLLFGSRNENRVMLNIGGIANLTLLPKSTDNHPLLSSDIAPGNTLMDNYVQKYFHGQRYDSDAKIAQLGRVNPALLAALKNNAFFDLPLPKTCGPELFNLHYIEQAQRISGTLEMTPESVMATLNKFSADMIAKALRESTRDLDNYTIYASGGGACNPLLLKNLERALGGKSVLLTDALSIHPDAKEAVLFAVLANECVAGENNTFNSENPKIPAVSMGKVCFYE